MGNCSFRLPRPASAAIDLERKAWNLGAGLIEGQMKDGTLWRGLAAREAWRGRGRRGAGANATTDDLKV